MNILAYQFYDNNNNVTRRGYIQLSGVEVSNGGHPDTERASVDIKYVNADGPMNFIRNSSIYNGIGWCVHVYTSNNVDIENNVFFNCEKFLTRALYSNNFTYTSNLLIAPRKRNLNVDSGLYDMVAGLDMYVAMEKDTGSNISITKNLVQGGDGNGFIVPGYLCGEKNIGFTSNYIYIYIYI